MMAQSTVLLPKFGLCNLKNKNFTALISEMMNWKRENFDRDWPGAAEYVRLVNPAWSQYKAPEFAYRYKMAKEEVESKLANECE